MNSPSPREVLSRHLLGSGIELGPGHSPFPLRFPGTAVRYVDRWLPEVNSGLFPELGDEAVFPKPDVVADLDTDRLSAFDDDSVDFVICSHVLEHVADPIGQLSEIHRVLRPGGTVLILLPDRHRTFDRDRSPTPLAHLVAEHDVGVDHVDDDHIEEFLRNTSDYDPDDPVARGIYFDPDDPEARRAYFDLHRQRSIHAHCWDQDEFVPVVEHGIEHLGHRWELVDGVLTAEGGPESIEFGFVLRRCPLPLSSAVLLERFELSWQAWRSDRLRRLAEADAVTVAELSAARAELEALRQTKLLRLSATARTYVSRLRR